MPKMAALHDDALLGPRLAPAGEFIGVVVVGQLRQSAPTTAAAASSPWTQGMTLLSV